jgi:glycosyltransferase 2 family protein
MILASHSESAQYTEEVPVPGRKPRLFTAIKIVLSVAVIVAVARNVDLEAAWQRFAHQNFWFPAAAVAILILQIGIGGLRWKLILRGLGDTSPIATSLRLYYISVFFNTWLWGAVGGDVLRAWLTHRAQFRLRQAVNSVVLDRVAAVAAVGILILATAPVFIRDTHQYKLALVLCGVAACLLGGIVVAALVHRVPIDWKRFKLFRGIHLLSTATDAIFLRINTVLPVLGVAILGQIVVAVAVYVMSLSLDVGLSLIDCVILMQPVALAVALPISVGGWGVRETAMIGLLGFIGIPSSAALSLSVQMGLLTIIASLPGAAFWLLHRQSHS